MFANMMAMALNPRLSADDFEKLCAQQLASQRALIETMMAQAEQMPLDQRVQYIGWCLPLIF